MSDNVRKWLQRGLLVFAVVCMVVFGIRFLQDQEGDAAYDNALELATRKETTEQTVAAEPEPTVSPTQIIERVWLPEPVTEEDEHITALQEIDLGALQEVNPDVIGWLFVPETKINYPIMQGEDNEFYLKHTWEKKPNAMGAVFMECRNSPDYTDFNTILYGHNMNSGAIFGDITKYSSSWFRSRNPYIYVVTEDGIYRYEVFSYHKAALDSFVYQLSFNQKETRENFINSARESSLFESDIVPEYTDRILTLSTCTGGSHDYRWVVHARLKMVLTEVE